MLFSFVVPAFKPKSDLFLPCLQSIINQEALTSDEFEIIVVDDGGASALAKSLNDGHVKIVKTAHIGPGGARNAGVLTAIGLFVIFVDSDDLLMPGFIKFFLGVLANDPKSDVFFFSFTSLQTETTVGNSKSISLSGPVIREKFSDKTLFAIENCDVRSIWAKAFRRSFLLTNDLHFDDTPGLVAEDVLFMLSLISKISSATFFPFVIAYYYRQVPSSISHKYDPKTIEKYELFFERYEKIIKTLPICFLDRFHYFVIGHYFLNVCALEISNKSNPQSLIGQTQTIRSLFRGRTYYRESLSSIKLKDEKNKRKKLLLFLLKTHQYFFVAVLMRIKNR